MIPDHISEEVRLMRANTISPSSRQAYRAATTQFLIWLLDNNPAVLNPHFIDAMQVDSNATAVHEYLDLAPDHPPIIFESFNINHFMQYIVSLRKADGSRLSYSTYNTHRAALFNIFRDYKIPMVEPLVSELKN